MTGEQIWGDSWNLSKASFDGNNLFFLREEYVSQTCHELNMSQNVKDAFIKGLSLFDKNPELKQIAWHCHWLLFQSKQKISVKTWPVPPKSWGEYASMLYAYVFLSGVPSVKSYHHSLDIPLEITIDTLSDLELWIKHHKTVNGDWGFSELSWLMMHFAGSRYKLGRLQFNFEKFRYPFLVFRNNHDHSVVVLVETGHLFRSDGQFDGANGVHDETGGWVSIYEETGDYFRGNLISPWGSSAPKIVELPKKTWTNILRREDPVLGIHIPATGPLNHDECGKSFAMARDFYCKYFPNNPYRAFSCTSWFLDYQFEKYISEANIVRFQKELYLHPIPDSNDDQMFERVFGKKYENISEAPQNSALQKCVTKHILNGGRWRHAGGILFPEDLNWGNRIYRKNKALTFSR